MQSYDSAPFLAGGGGGGYKDILGCCEGAVRAAPDAGLVAGGIVGGGRVDVGDEARRVAADRAVVAREVQGTRAAPDLIGIRREGRRRRALLQHCKFGGDWDLGLGLC